jgi:DNA-binding NarL/FixJ family response regulator
MPEQAIEHALTGEDRTSPVLSVPGQRSAEMRPDALTSRQKEIATLIAQGLTNRQIASKLFISERTVENHMSKILRKLQLTSRAQVAAWATEQRLLMPEPD